MRPFRALPSSAAIRTALLAVALAVTASASAQTPDWTYVAPEKILFTPTVGGDGTAYFATDDSLIRAVSPSGVLLWAVNPGGRPSAPMALQGGLLFFPASQNLCAYSTAGNMAWKLPLHADVPSTPAVAADGTLYVGTAGSLFYSITPGGRIRWSHNCGDPIVSSPVIDHVGRIYVATTRLLYAFEPNGQVDWIRAIPALSPASRLVVGGAEDSSGHSPVYFVDSASDLQCVGPSGGSPWSSLPSVTGSGTTPVVGRFYLYLVSGTAPTPTTGHSISGTITTSTGSSPVSGVTVTAVNNSGGTGGSDTTAADGTYSVTSLADGTYTLTPTKSGVTFTPTTNQVTVSGQDVAGINFTASSTAVAAASTEASTTTSQVVAFSLVDGSSPWSVSHGSTAAPAVDANGILWVPDSTDSAIYALDATNEGQVDSTLTLPTPGVPQDVVLIDNPNPNGQNLGKLYVVAGGRQLLRFAVPYGPGYDYPWNQLCAGPRHLSRRDDPPSVPSFTAPSGATVSGAAQVAVDVTDDFPSSLTVRFSADGAGIGTVTGPPYEVTWYTGTVANGTYTLTAEAKDSAGNRSQASMDVTVQNDTQPMMVYPDAPPIPFTWPAGGDSLFRVDFSLDPDFGTVLTDSHSPGKPWLKATTWKPGGSKWKKILGVGTGKTDDTDVYWRVVGKTAGTVASGTLRISRPLACDGLTPIDGSDVPQNPIPQLTWNGEHNQGYQAQLSDASDFSKILLTSKVPGRAWLKTPAWTPAQKGWKKLPTGARYYWRVLAKDSLGRQTTSTVQSIVITP